MVKPVMYGDATQQEKPQCPAGLGQAIFELTTCSSFGAPGTSFWPAGRQETAAGMRVSEISPAPEKSLSLARHTSRASVCCCYCCVEVIRPSEISAPR